MKKLLIALLFLSFTFVGVSTVSSQELCGLLPCNQYDNSNFPIIEGDVNAQFSNYVRWGVSAIFLLIVLYGVYVVVQAGVKIVRSEGDTGKIEEGQKMIKGVMIGIGIIFIGVVGLIIVLAFFNAGSITNTPINVPDNVEVPLLTE